jgi:GDP/UDP-N,N'-diacetylbacillosamine 2-epimerase (hydrolysing)
MKICIISGSRSELDLLKNLILEIKKDKFFNSKLLVTGSHLSKFFGNTVEYIKNQNLNIHNYINISIKGDSSEQVSKSFSLGVTKFTKIFSKIKPDAIVVLGDRYEIFSSVISATLKKIPVVHIHGGEVTAGSMDEGIRHSITKLSHIHFVSTEEYKRRVIQLGENKKNVFNVGSLGAQSIKKIKLLNKTKLEKLLKIKFLKKITLVSFHPETLEKKTNSKNLENFLNVLKNLNEYTIVFTMPNADIGYKSVFNKINNFVKNNQNAFLFKSLGHQKYFSLCKLINFYIGNSSSGIIELASFNKPSINLGQRQAGRLKPNNVIDCDFKKENIFKAIQIASSLKFKKRIRFLKNPYYKGDTSKKIVKSLKKINLNKILYKKFFDTF